MNIKYSKAVEGRSDGADILHQLGIQDSDKFEKAKLAAIEQTVKALNEGVSLQDAVKSAIALANTDSKSTAIAHSDPTAIAKPVSSQEIPKDFIEEIGGEIRKTGQEYADELPGAIADYTQDAMDNTDSGLRGVVNENFFAGMVNQVRKPEFKDRVREEIKKRRTQRSSAN